MQIATEETLNEILGTSSVSEGKGSNDSAATDQGHEEAHSSEGTLNTDDQGGDKATGSTDGGGDAPDQGDTKGADGTSDEGDKQKPYHENPLTQRLLKERNEARERAARLEGRLEAIEEARTEVKGKGDGADGGDLGYIDITTKTEDELVEWQARDPKGYAANILAQAKAEVKGELVSDSNKEAQERSKAEVRKTYETYAAKNPDFKEMWEDGKIQEYMRTHPGHTALSAHMEMTEPARFARAVKAKEKEIEGNILAKRRASGGLGVGGGGPRKGFTHTEDPALKDTKAGGGLVATIANKLRLSRMNTT
jgi:hypothetical protein